MLFIELVKDTIDDIFYTYAQNSIEMVIKIIMVIVTIILTLPVILLDIILLPVEIIGYLLYKNQEKRR